MKRITRSLAITVALSVSVFASGAAAQEEPPRDEDSSSSEAARLLVEGRAALDAGKVAEACALMEKSAAAGGGSDALLASGQCHELQGKTATAWREYTAASRAAVTEGVVDREDRARTLAGKLAPRLSKLRIDVIAPVAGQAVRRNGQPVDPSTFGALVAVDPGTYAVTATAPGLTDFSASVVVGSDADAQVILVPALQRPSPPGTHPAQPLAPVKRDGVVRTVSPMGIAGFVTTTLGVVGLAMGTAFGVMALNEAGEAEDDPRLCPNKVCTPAGMSIVDEARTKSTVSTVAFSVGGTALAAGITLFLLREFTDLEKKDEFTPKSVSVEPMIGLGTVGATVHFD